MIQIYMKKNWFILLALLITALACKKNDDSTTNGKKCKMQIYSETQNGETHPYNVINYIYDGNGNFIQTMTINYGNTYMGREHKYLNNVLQYAFYSPKLNWWDTVYYYFSAGNQLDSTIEHDNDWSSIDITRTQYLYNINKQVIYSNSRTTNNGQTKLIDSTFYCYKENNVTKVRRYYKSGSVHWDSLILDLSFDNKKNYYKTTGMPAMSYYYWSENNIVRIVDAQTSETISLKYFTAYNQAGYPTEIRDTVGEWTHKVNIIYQ